VIPNGPHPDLNGPPPAELLWSFGRRSFLADMIMTR
jgi:hypothetical protein